MQKILLKNISPLFYCLLFLGMMNISACTTTTTATSGTTKKSTSKTVEKEEKETLVANVAPGIEEQIMDAVNNYRKQKGLPALQSNFVIGAEARHHSMNMATKRVAFGHNGISARMKIIMGKVDGVTDVAENVAHGSMTAKQVVDGWIKSTAHRKNIEGNFTLTGIGVARNQKSELYFTQIFAK